MRYGSLPILLTLCLSICLSFQLQAQDTLSLSQIMQGEDFVGYLPEDIYWSDNSQYVYFSWNPEHNLLRDIYGLEVGEKDPFKLTIAERKALPPSDYDMNENRTLSVYEKNGDIFLHDLRTETLIQVTQTVEAERNPVLSQDELFIYYQRGNNLFSWAIDGGSTTQLTNFQQGSKPDEEKPSTNQQAWLERDQFTYFEIIRKRDTIENLREMLADTLKPDRPEEIYLGKKRLASLEPSPTGDYIFYFLLQPSSNAGNTTVADFVTQSGYLSDLNARPKVGSPETQTESWIYDRKRDTTYQIETDSIPGIKDKPLYLRNYLPEDSTWVSAYETPRSVIVHPPAYSPDGRNAIVVARSTDNKDRWILSLEPSTGKLSLLDRQRDEAWIGGPGISNYNFSSGNIGWLADYETIWFQSEETGYSHLFTLHIPTMKKTALTVGEYEVQDVWLSKDKDVFYYISNEIHAGEKHLYRMQISGEKKEQLTEQAGAHEIEMSPNEKYLAIRYAYTNQPWELYIMQNRAGAKMRQITESQTEKFQDYDWRVPEIIQFTARDSVQVPARLYEPDKSVKNGAAIIFVHGAGYLQNVHKWWSSYFREYMFHNLLADKGYTVLDIDYRGSAGYGRDWRTAIYRHMGGKDLTDQVDGAEYLIENYEIDSSRIGIYGGSYGGFITLMALFLEAETFACGAALRSVTDWAHYNHPYTSNILNIPETDSIAYRRSSPIYHAEGLDDPLVMLHGMVDTNVQFQDVVRLAQRFIELGREDWELAVFPTEGHGFEEANSWADEYRRIYKLFKTHLEISSETE